MRPLLRYTGAAVVIGAVLLTGRARADDTSAVAGATVLFDEGVKLMESGRYAEACPKLARSQALAPNGGTLLALGDCYEKIGRTATAWVTFREVAARAASAGKHDAEASALARAKALEIKLPRLTITVPPSSQVAGLEIRRDGEVVKQAELGLPVPVDPGPHEIRASVPHGKPWVRSVTMRASGSEDVVVPPLSGEGAGEPRVGADGGVTDPGGETSSTGKTQRIVGLVVAGVGLASLGVGGAFGLLAKSKNDEALERENCPTSTRCTARGLDLTDDARSKALISTILVAVGATGLVVGGIVFFTAPKGGAATHARSLRIAPTWASGSVGGTAAIAW